MLYRFRQQRSDCNDPWTSVGDLEAMLSDFQNKCVLLDFVGHHTLWCLRAFSTANNYSTDENVLVMEL